MRSSTPAKKQVSFSKQAFVYRIKSYSESRYQSLIWYSVSDMADSKNEAAQLAEALETMESTSHEDWRGLEARGPQGRWEAYKARLDASNAVLDAHDQKVSSRKLSLVAKKASAASVDQAIARALVDAQVAARYCNNEEQRTSTSHGSQKWNVSPAKSPVRQQTHRFRRVTVPPQASLVAQRA